MVRPQLEVADIFRQYGTAFQASPENHVSNAQRRVINAVSACRTAALGGHLDECDGCGHRRISYNSCRNRHCPKCQSLAKAQWLADREAELLPVQYFHVVFTLPDCLAPLALQNKRVVYNLLFRVASRTLLQIAADPKHLGAEIGFLAILHTWGQNLMHHPHLHCVVPGGGLCSDEKRWVGCRKNFFLPVRVLSRLFRRLFLQALEQAFVRGQLEFYGSLQDLSNSTHFENLLITSRSKEWVVYAKAPFGGPSQVLHYLGQYTHRVAISNHRLISSENGQITFRWKDYRHNNRQKVMTIAAIEFMRRFLLHVLPNGFQRIRYFGWLRNRHRAAKLALCRQLLESRNEKQPLITDVKQNSSNSEQIHRLSLTCPQCGFGQMLLIEYLPPQLSLRPP